MQLDFQILDHINIDTRTSYEAITLEGKKLLFLSLSERKREKERTIKTDSCRESRKCSVSYFWAI